MAMFPQFSAVPGAPPAPGSSALLSFKAGKMEMTNKGDDVYHITPDLRKGTISLFKGQDDRLMHFAWKERPSGNVVDDIIILPEEAVYKKVDTGKEGERVYLMEIAGNRRFFYWMQDKDADKDEENMKKVNELTNSPPADEAPSARAASALGPEMMDLLGSMGAGPSGAGLSGMSGGGASGSNPSEHGLNIQNLQTILQNMGFSPQEQAAATAVPSPFGASSTSSTSASAAGSASATTGDASTATQAPAAAGNSGGGGSGGPITTVDLEQAMRNVVAMTARPPATRLTDVVNADAIEASGMLDDPNVQTILTPLLPEGQQTAADLRETIRSPQLQQTLTALSQALQTENFNNIMSSFELDPRNSRSAEAMARDDSVTAFLQALMHAAEANQGRESAAPTSASDEGQGGDSMNAEDG